MNVRSITFGLNDENHTKAILKEKTELFFKLANECFTSRDIEVFTNRINLEVVNDTVQYNKDEILEKVKTIDWLCKELDIRWFCVPFTSFVDYDKREIAQTCLEIIKRYPSAFTNLIVASDNRVSLEGAKIASKIIKDVSKLSHNGYDNFRMGTSFNCNPHTPFFPYTFHNNKSGFSVALETIDVFTKAIHKSNTKNIIKNREKILNLIIPELSKVNEICKEIEAKTSMNYYGIDASLAPFPGHERSVASLIELLGVESFGNHGTLFFTSYLTDILKEALLQSKVKQSGFNGVMFSLLEDSGIAKRNTSKDITIDSLLAYSTVCGCGIDMVPIPGDSFEEEISSLIIDVAGISSRLNKPLGLRLLPVPLKKENEFTEYNYDFICNSRIMSLGSRGCTPAIFEEELEFLGKR